MLGRSGGFTRRLGRRAALLVELDLAIVLALGVHLGGGIVSGASPSPGVSDPFLMLGTQLGETSCPKAPIDVGTGTYVVCPNWTAVVSPAGIVEVVSIYGPGNSVVDPYPGALPYGLAWGDSVTSAWDNLGRANRITSAYTTPTLVYFFTGKPYGSLELRYDANQRLKRINASLVH